MPPALDHNPTTRDGFAAMCEEVFDPLWRLLSKLIGGKDEIADILQETFLAAAKSASQYDASRGTSWQWIVGIARNQLAIYYRKEARNNRVAPGGDLYEALANRLDGEGDATNPELALTSEETAAQVRFALTSMMPHNRDLLISFYLAEISVDQIANEQKKTESAVRSQLQRARKEFSGILRNSGETQNL